MAPVYSQAGIELLIDVTSHELRQPVSAIINCAALIRSNIISLREELSTCQAKASSFIPTKETLDVMDQDLEALDAIYQCGLAQGVSHSTGQYHTVLIANIIA